MAAKANQEAQHHYKHQYDKSSTSPKYQIGDWVFVCFPSEEAGKLCKLSQPYHGSYQIISRDDPDVMVTKVYDPPLQIPQLKIKNCPVSFLCGYYWHGNKRRRPECPPKWLEKLLMSQPPDVVEARSCDIVYTLKDKQRKKPTQQSKEADNLLLTIGNQSGE